MAGEGVPKPILTPEALPGIDLHSSREVEASVQCTDEERERLEEAFKARAVEEPERAHLSDIRIWIPGFHGVARVRTITQPHVVPEPPPKYEWAVKIFMPRDKLRFAKAPYEHQGKADSIEDAVEILKKVMAALGHEFAVQSVDALEQDRTIYTMENGVRADINVCTWKNGHTLTPPHQSAEFELPLHHTATDEEIGAAENEIVVTAKAVGISEEQLTPSRGLSNRQPSATHSEDLPQDRAASGPGQV
jgi:hypothetical protein